MKYLTLFTLLLLVACSQAPKSGHLYSEQIRDSLSDLCTEDAKDVHSCAVGMGIGKDLFTAKDIAIDAGRLELAKRIKVHVKELDEEYQKKMDGRTFFAGGTTISQFVNLSLSGSTPHESSIYFEEHNGQYTVQVIVSISQESIKRALESQFQKQTDDESKMAFQYLRSIPSVD